MMAKGKVLLAVVLIGLLIILTQSDIYRKTFFPKSYKLDKLRKEQVHLVDQLKQSEEIITNEKTVEIKSYSPERIFSQSNKVQERLVKVVTNLFEATLSTRGATIIGWRLKNFVALESSFFEMLLPEAQGNLGISFSASDSILDTGQLVFNCSADSVNILEGENLSIEFNLNLDDNSKISKRFTFTKDRVEFINMGDIIEEWHYDINWKSGLAPDNKLISNRALRYAKACVSVDGFTDQYKRTDGRDMTLFGEIEWAAIRNKDFLVAIVPKTHRGREAKIRGEAFVDENTQSLMKRFQVDLSMPFTYDDIDTDTFLVYCGPPKHDIIKEVRLESIMDRKWIGFELSRVVLLWLPKPLKYLTILKLIQYNLYG